MVIRHRGTAARAGVLALALAAAGFSPLLAATIEVPPLVEPASPEHHIGKVVFLQLVTPDLAGAEAFYAGLFGWTYQSAQTGDLEYAEASLDGRPVAGLVHRPIPAGQRRQPAWLSFLSVRDADAATKVAVLNGAQVLVGPHDVPDRGREAVFADPQGAVFAVLASSSGDPPDLLADPGDWIWSTLITSNPDTDAAFYQILFDYEVFEQPDVPGEQHFILSTDAIARASANSLPAGRPNARPHWLNYVRVDDAAATTAKVEKLGGRVLVAPRLDRHGGKIAVVADPQGAPFGLLEWTATAAVGAVQ